MGYEPKGGKYRTTVSIQVSDGVIYEGVVVPGRTLDEAIELATAAGEIRGHQRSHVIGQGEPVWDQATNQWHPSVEVINAEVFVPMDAVVRIYA